MSCLSGQEWVAILIFAHFVIYIHTCTYIQCHWPDHSFISWILPDFIVFPVAWELGIKWKLVTFFVQEKWYHYYGRNLKSKVENVTKFSVIVLINTTLSPFSLIGLSWKFLLNTIKKWNSTWSTIMEFLLILPPMLIPLFSLLSQPS